MVGLNIYIISLRNSPRREFREKQFSKLGLDFKFINAITKDDISNQDNDYTNWERPLHLSEIACYKSHRNAWKITSSSNNPSLILEDDALISNELPKLIQDIISLKNADYINLENRNRKKIVSKKKTYFNGVFSFLKLYHDSTGAAGYILYPNGARKLLNFENRHGFALADAQISRCNSLYKYQVEPALIIQLDMTSIYKISTDDRLFQLSQSTVSFTNKPRKSFSYFYRRVYSQFKLGIRKIYLSFYTVRRDIDIAAKDSFDLS